jgi:hypothetical protein
MHTRLGTILGATLGLTGAYAGCTALENLDGLQFDVVADGGSGGGSGSSSSSSSGSGSGSSSGSGSDGGDASAQDASCAPAGYTCGAPPPPGWMGPIAVYEGTPGMAPLCPTDYPTQALDGGTGLNADPATCSACTCSTPAVTCGPVQLAAYTQSSCMGTATQTVMLAAGACTNVSGFNFAETAPQASVGACQPSGGIPSLLPPMWASEGIACASSGQGTTCADGSLCVPAPPAPFEARWCVWRSGSQSCPPGFPQSHVWETAVDTRGCTPCACGSPTSATCSAKTTLYSDVSCQKSVGNLSNQGQCSSPWNTPQTASATATPTGSPSCPASGGAPTGTVTASVVATICCLP